MAVRLSGPEPAPLAFGQVTCVNDIKDFLIPLEGHQVFKRELCDIHLACVQDQEDDLKRATSSSTAANDPLAVPDFHGIRPRRSLHDAASLFGSHPVFRN